MFRIFLLGGAGCLFISSAAYIRLFLRRDSYSSPLDYARALSGSAALDRRLSDHVIRDVTWLKFFSNILYPFVAAIALVFAIMPGGEVPRAARAAWIFAAGVTVAALLTVKLFRRVSFALLMLSHVALAVASFFPVPFLGETIPVWTSVIGVLTLGGNVIYMTRRCRLFFAADSAGARQKHSEAGKSDSSETRQRLETGKPHSAKTRGQKSETREADGAQELFNETFTPDMLAPSDRLEWMLSESSGQKPETEWDIL